MTGIQLQSGELWEISGERHFFDQAMGSGFLLFRSERTGAPYQVELDTGECVSPTMDWLISQFADGLAKRLIHLPRAPLAQQEAALRGDDFDAIVARDPRAEVRQVVLASLDRISWLSKSDKALRQTLVAIWEAKPRHLAGKTPPSPSTVRRWLRQRGETGNRALKVMVNMSGRVSRKKQLPASVRRRMHEEAIGYWADHSRSIAESYDSLASYLKGLNRYIVRQDWATVPVPSKETFRQHVRSLECYDTVAAKWGSVEANTRFKGIGKGLAAHRPLLLGAMDHTVLDVHLVFELDEFYYLGRPWLTILIDVHSRCIVGWVLSFEPPQLYSITECIKRTNRPKMQMLDQFPNCRDLADIYGKFDEIVVDNGLEFVGTSFESGMTDIGTSVRWAPSASPTYKAVVERFFGSLNKLFNQRLPGGSFSIEKMRAWKLNPQKDAVLTLDQAEDLLEHAIGVYHQNLHSHLGEPPVAAWTRGVRAQGGVQVIGDDSQLDKMVGAEVTRRLSRSGISLFGLSYHDPAVTGPLLEDLAASEPMRDRRKGSATANVKVKYNPANIGSVHVWNAKRGCFQTLPCTDPDYAEGLTKWQNERIREWTITAQKKSADERLKLRTDLSERLRDCASPAARKRIDRKRTRLLTSPRIQDLAGDHLRLACAEPRHDGMSPIIPQATLASERTDGHPKPVRSQRGKAKRAKAKQSATDLSASQAQLWTPQGDTADWESFQ